MNHLERRFLNVSIEWHLVATSQFLCIGLNSSSISLMFQKKLSLLSLSKEVEKCLEFWCMCICLHSSFRRCSYNASKLIYVIQAQFNIYFMKKLVLEWIMFILVYSCSGTDQIIPTYYGFVIRNLLKSNLKPL